MQKINTNEFKKAPPLEGLGRLAIVTGASGNLGQAIVKKFIYEGYFVVGTIVPNDPVQIDFPADKFKKIVVDLMNEDDAQKFVDALL